MINLQDLTFFEKVFLTIHKWDTSWETSKTGNFWEIKVTQLEIKVQSLLKLLNGFMKQLNDENWKLIEITRDNVDAFRRVLPLISNLKNPAMRRRHWNEVQSVMNK